MPALPFFVVFVVTRKYEMKLTILFSAAVCFALPAMAQSVKVESFALDSLHLDGAYCEFGVQQNTLLASDWDGKFWMKIDGKMVAFQSQRTDADIEVQLKSKRWRERLSSNGFTVDLNLTETGRGDDTAAFQGNVEVSRGGWRKRILVSGGCGA